MSEQTFDFDALEHVKHSNTRGTGYQLKRSGDNKFVISNLGKSIIGHDPEKGVDLRAGNGVVLMACRPVEHPDNNKGLLKGTKGNTFTSKVLETKIIQNEIESEFYNFVEQGDYKGAKFFRLEPTTVEEGSPEALEASTDELEGQEENIEGTADDTQAEDAQAEESPNENPGEVSVEQDDEF